MSGRPADVLTDALSANQAEERRKALRALLSSPLLTAHGSAAAAFRLTRRHQTWLREWFARETGWVLHVDAETARLRKTPADCDDSRPALTAAKDRPFSRRRYVLLCLALAALERADHQVTLGRLAEAVLASAGDEALAAAGMTFTLDDRDQRGDLVAAVRLLINLGVLRRVAGDEQAFATGSGDALYDVERRVLASMLVTRRGPSTITAPDLDGRLAAATEELIPDSDDARNRALRHALTRRLLDDPVVYYDDLSEDELAYLAKQRATLLRRVAEATGLVPEVRAEGIAMLDADGDLTDVKMPEVGTDGHATLLLAEHVAKRDRDTPGQAVSPDELYAHVRRLADEHRSVWRKKVFDPGGVDKLCDEAVERLVSLRLLARAGRGVVARPALARFALGDVIDPQQTLA